MPGAPSVPLPINGRPNNKFAGALIAASTSSARTCRELALAASAAAYVLLALLNTCTNCSWKAAACLPSIWYSSAWAENSDAIAVDTSSAAAASSLLVGAKAASLAASIEEPIPAASVATVANTSGVATRYDILFSNPANLLAIGRR
ncbi:hypothetical protein MYBA111488_05440 [Mycobacterium basiliense]